MRTNHARVGKLTIPHSITPFTSSSQPKNTRRGPASRRRNNRFKDVGRVGCSHFRSILATAVTQNSMLLTRHPQPIAGTLPLSAGAVNLTGRAKKGSPMTGLEKPDVANPFKVATLWTCNRKVSSLTNSGMQLQFVNTVYTPRILNDAWQIMRN